MANARMITNAVNEASEAKEKVEPKTTPIFGVVDNCELLNVRANPSLKAEVVTTVAQGTKLEIDKRESRKDFWKVKTDKFEGFCLKEFVTVE